MKLSSNRTIDVTPVRHEVVSAEEFLRLTTEQPHLIERSRFVSPVPGKRGFGKFEVTYITPIFKRAFA